MYTRMLLLPFRTCHARNEGCNFKTRQDKIRRYGEMAAPSVSRSPVVQTPTKMKLITSAEFFWNLQIQFKYWQELCQRKDGVPGAYVLLLRSLGSRNIKYWSILNFKFIVLQRRTRNTVHKFGIRRGVNRFSGWMKIWDHGGGRIGHHGGGWIGFRIDGFGLRERADCGFLR